MIINHNLMANNALRNMNINSNNASKAMEKLSSGLRINRAGDDAAGLAISEKMRGQINGLNQASSNSQDAISLIQTAEGALNETHSILQRMRTLSTQSASDTNTSSDRQNIQKEVDQLSEEITRISNTTQFNTQNLLNGGMKAGNVGEDTFQIGANNGQSISININAMDAKSLGVSRDVKAASMSSNTAGIDSVEADNGIDTKLAAGSYKVTVVDTPAGTPSTSKTGAVTVGADAVTGTANADTSVVLTYNEGDSKWVANGSFVGDITSSQVVNGLTIDTSKLTSMSDGDTVTITASKDESPTTVQLFEEDGSTAIGDAITIDKANGGTYNVGDTTTGELAVTFTAGSATAGTAAVTVADEASTTATFANGQKQTDAISTGGIDVSTQKSASIAITKIDAATQTVSAERAKLGAYQNRLEHTINNLGTSSENLTSAESRIRDVDMASEMSEYSKNNILSQAAQAMLAQANQQPQQVLQLLR